MKFDFMPSEYVLPLNNAYNDICEIRLRTGFPVKVKINLTDYYLSKKSITALRDEAIICKSEHICEIINNVTERSLYAYNDRISKGYITTENGIRIGLAGECVCESLAVHTIKNFTSLNIRVPHEIQGCSNLIINQIVCGDEIHNTLIISPPLHGKTTILKDIARNLSQKNIGAIMVIDERSEFSSVKGENIDIINNADKLFAFEYGLRSLSPNIVVTDELQTERDWECVKKASSSGVKIIASCHAYDVTDLIKKEGFDKEVFEKYVVLRASKNIGEIYKTYDKGFVEI